MQSKIIRLLQIKIAIQNFGNSTISHGTSDILFLRARALILKVIMPCA